MALQFILGGSGSGKSHRMYSDLVDEAAKNPEKNYIMLVPEQYTMQTQKNIVERHERHGVMNIDIVSFERLAYRVFDEFGIDYSHILGDTGKRIVIRKVLEEKKQDLSVFKGSIRKSGFSGELKSVISEFMQYNVVPEKVETCIGKMDKNSVLKGKLTDLNIVYQGFLDYIRDHYLTTEEILVKLVPLIHKSEIIRESSIYLDNFTGFTPAQYMVMKEILTCAPEAVMTLTIDDRSKLYEKPGAYELFALTKETLWSLERLCSEIHCERKKDIILSGDVRCKGREDLSALESGLYRTKTAPYDQLPENVFLYRAERPQDEIRHTARQIRRLVRDGGYRYRDIAVVCADLTSYRHLVEECFDEMMIPCFIDVKRNILDNAFVECIRSLLEMFADNFSYESSFRFLRSGFSSVEQEDIDKLENYVIRYGFRGASMWKKEWELPGVSEGEAKYINQIRQDVFQNIWSLHELFCSKEALAKEQTEGLIEWIKAEMFEEKLKELSESFEALGKLSLAKEYMQVYDTVIELLSKFDAILGNEKISLKEYRDIFDAALSEEKVGLIPPGIDQVTVGDIQRTRLDRIKVLFFMGLNDGIIPAPVKDGGLITDRDKMMLTDLGIELAPTARQLTYYEQFYIYAALSKASEKLYLSYSSMDSKGKELRPSTLLKRIERILPKLESQSDSAAKDWEDYLYNPQDAFMQMVEGLKDIKNEIPSARWQELYSWFLGQEAYKERTREAVDAAFASYIETDLTENAVALLYGEILENSITTLEKYAACAYAHFLRYGLGLEPRRDSKIKAPDLGVILHRAMELFAEKLKEKGESWKTVSNELREELSIQCAQEAADELKGQGLFDSERSRYQIQRLIRHVLRTTWAVQKQLAPGEFEPYDFEVRFDTLKLDGVTEFSVGENVQMKLKGTIDRIDLCEKDNEVYVKIVDYKSSEKKFDVVELYEGRSLQLAIYMNAAKALVSKEHPDKIIIPAAILYYHMDDPIVENADFSQIEGTDSKILEALKPKGIVNQSSAGNSETRIVDLLDCSIKNNRKSSVIPVSCNKDGSFSKSASVISSEQFDNIGWFAKKKARQFGDEILSGKISVNPYKKNDQSACDYCDYRSICGFDEKISGYGYKKLTQMKAEDVWEYMDQERREEEKTDGSKVDK